MVGSVISYITSDKHYNELVAEIEAGTETEAILYCELQGWFYRMIFFVLYNGEGDDVLLLVINAAACMNMSLQKLQISPAQ